ncbi:ATP-binding protein [Sphaerisporangium sp. TRM90804]|uniref:ATP-binding protein n=1 Tax=Sphaerisporangium sp. TRM90804 TaxID=3031113 RepID=UPI0024493A41|nr:ATP-binding protein [Sphaerisporangium sp. TRM90804]MDH2424425.1 ATP-binding protein [Sphaerisporangium sp. TRM90804]
MGKSTPPCEVERRLAEDLDSITEARQVISRALEACGYRGEHDMVVLAVSELVTNALIHGAGAPVLRLSCQERGVRLEVADSRPELPRPREPDADGGWGLHVIDQLATCWGISPQRGGKVVWCEFAAPPAPAPPAPVAVTGESAT